MATIITRLESSIDQLASDLQTLFDFVKAEDQKYYITNDTYIKIWLREGTESATFDIGNSNGDLLRRAFPYTSSTIKYMLVKTESGDILCYGANGSASVKEDNKHLAFSIVRVHNAAGDESWGVFSAATGVISATAADAGNVILICDDTTSASEVTKVSSTPGGTSYSNFIFGNNINTKVTLLVDTFAMHTAWTTKNMKIMLITERPYNGACTINGKDYYCHSFFAFLDEGGEQ